MARTVSQGGDGFWRVSGQPSTQFYATRAVAVRVAANLDAADLPTSDAPSTSVSEAAQNTAIAAAATAATTAETDAQSGISSAATAAAAAATAATDVAALKSSGIGAGADLVGFSASGSEREGMPNKLGPAVDVILGRVNAAQSAADAFGPPAPLRRAALLNADRDLFVATASLWTLAVPISTDRTLTLQVDGVGPRETITIMRRASALAGGHDLFVVNGGPGGGDLGALASDAARVFEFVMNDAGTDWILLRQARLIN